MLVLVDAPRQACLAAVAVPVRSTYAQSLANPANPALVAVVDPAGATRCYVFYPHSKQIAYLSSRFRYNLHTLQQYSARRTLHCLRFTSLPFQLNASKQFIPALRGSRGRGLFMPAGKAAELLDRGLIQRAANILPCFVVAVVAPVPMFAARSEDLTIVHVMPTAILLGATAVRMLAISPVYRVSCAIVQAYPALPRRLHRCLRQSRTKVTGRWL